jgi:hypothetical protein
MKFSLPANKRNLQYLRDLEEGYPKRIFWKVIAPKDAKLSKLQQSDAIFDEYDLKIRKLV